MQTLSTPRRRAKGGFTLIELVVVIVILAVLAAVIVPNFMHRTEDAKIANTVATIKTLDGAIDMYSVDTGSLPNDLDALIKDPQIKGWNGPYLKNQSTVPMDQWGHPYTYKQPGENGHSYDIISAGPDGKNMPITNTTATGG